MESNEINNVEENVNTIAESDSQINENNLNLQKDAIPSDLPSPEKKKSKKGLVIAVILLIIVLVITICIFLMHNDEKEENNNPNQSSNSTNIVSNENLTDTNTNTNSASNEVVSNTNSNSNENYPVQTCSANLKGNNQSLDIKNGFLDLTSLASYQPDVSYDDSNSFTLGETETDFVTAKIEISNKKAYIVYGNKKIEIKNVNNVKEVQAISFSRDCESLVMNIYLLTDDGKIYYYLSEALYWSDSYDSSEKSLFPNTDSEIEKFANTIASNFKNWSLSKQYSSISFAGVPCGPGCGCGYNLIGVATDCKQYVITQGEKLLNTYYDYSYLSEEYYVSLDGKIYTDYWSHKEGKYFNFKPKYIFDVSVNKYALSTDLYLYELDYEVSNKKVNNSKVSKIGITQESEDSSYYKLIVYFEDGSELKLESVFVVKF